MSDFYSPTNNTNIPLRPLTKGMIRNVAPQMMPIGSFYDVQNMYITENGPKRAGGFKPSGNGDSLDVDTDGTVWDLLTYQHSGTLETLAITDKTVKKFDFQSGFSDLSVNTADIPIDEDVFKGDKTYNIDYTIIPSASGAVVLFADGSNYIRQYNGTEISTWDETYANPLTIEFFNNRLWIGSPTSSSVNRLTWSDLDVSLTLDVSNYLDFLDERDDILAIKGLGNLLVVYFPKAIYFGRPTNRVDLPYAFTKIETGQIGLVGKKAIAQWDDGHFFVGSDDVYYFSASSSLEAIGTPIIQEMIKNCQFKEGIYVTVDPLNDLIIFGVPEEGPDITTIWYFNYKTKAWSRTNDGRISASMLATVGTFTARTWDTDGDDSMVIDGTSITNWDDSGAGSFSAAGFKSWKSLESSLSLEDLFLCIDNTIYQNEDLDNYDFNESSSPISIVLESGDLDLDLPDQTKCFNRLSLKIQEPTLDPIRFILWTSNNRGRTWEEKGEFLINEDTDEGRINFRSHGSTFRFKLTSMSTVAQYIINEIVIRGRPRGIQV